VRSNSIQYFTETKKLHTIFRISSTGGPLPTPAGEAPTLGYRYITENHFFFSFPLKGFIKHSSDTIHHGNHCHTIGKAA
jgi:hypothetical protein